MGCYFYHSRRIHKRNQIHFGSILILYYFISLFLLLLFIYYRSRRLPKPTSFQAQNTLHREFVKHICYVRNRVLGLNINIVCGDDIITEETAPTNNSTPNTTKKDNNSIEELIDSAIERYFSRTSSTTSSTEISTPITSSSSPEVITNSIAHELSRLLTLKATSDSASKPSRILEKMARQMTPEEFEKVILFLSCKCIYWRCGISYYFVVS